MFDGCPRFGLPVPLPQSNARLRAHSMFSNVSQNPNVADTLPTNKVLGHFTHVSVNSVCKPPIEEVSIQSSDD